MLSKDSGLYLVFVCEYNMVHYPIIKQPNMRKNILQLITVFFILIFFSSCAPASDSDTEYGFFGGLLHGFVFIFALIGKLFGADVGIYAENNTGFFYWLGFIIGIGSLGGGGYQSSRKR